jgi:hypothetical protein
MFATLGLFHKKSTRPSDYELVGTTTVDVSVPVKASTVLVLGGNTINISVPMKAPTTLLVGKNTNDLGVTANPANGELLLGIADTPIPVSFSV